MKQGTHELLVLVGKCADFAHSSAEEWVYASLSAAQQETIQKNRRPQDRTRRLLARFLLALGVQQLDGTIPQKTLAALTHAPSGQPHLPGTALHISFTHAGEYAACVIGKSTTAPHSTRVGIDIEQVQPLQLEDFQRVFTLAEMQEIRDLSSAQNSQNMQDELIRRWTLKEAILKVQGTGFLADPLELDTTQCPITAIMPTLAWTQKRLGTYWLSIAAESAWTTLRVLMPEDLEAIV